MHILVTKTKVIEKTHGFKNSVTMRKKSTNTEGINFLLSACSLEGFSFTFRFHSFKLRSDVFSNQRVLLNRVVFLPVSEWI